MVIRSPAAYRSRVTFAATLLLVAWMPSLLFFGHWTELASPSGAHPTAVASHDHGSGAPSDAAEHAAHCHGSSSCANGGGSTSAPDLAAANPLALASRPIEVGAAAASTTRIEGRSTAAPDAPPPRLAA